MNKLQAAKDLLSNEKTRYAIASRASRATTLSKTNNCGYQFRLAQGDYEALGLNPSYSIFFYVNSDAVSFRAILDADDDADISACVAHDRSDPNGA